MRRSTLARPTLAALLAALPALLGACSSPTDARGVCPQTYEFGNQGCAVVEGRVTDGAGDPVRNMTVVPRGSLVGCCDTPVVRTGEDGRYRLELHWFATPVGEAAPAELEDAWIVAVTPRRGAVDSVSATIRFAPVGRPAPVTVVDLPLDVVF